jgi:hypothetical protein
MAFLALVGGAAQILKRARGGLVVLVGKWILMWREQEDERVGKVSV